MFATCNKNGTLARFTAAKHFEVVWLGQQLGVMSEIIESQKFDSVFLFADQGQNEQ